MNSQLATQDQGVKVGEGEIRTDMQRMDHKLGLDYKKLWEHRISLLWNEFGQGIMIGSCPVISGSVGWYYLQNDNLGNRIGGVLSFAIVGGFAIFLGGYLAVEITRKFINGPVKRIKKDWNGNSLSERLLEHKKNKE